MGVYQPQTILDISAFQDPGLSEKTAFHFLETGDLEGPIHTVTFGELKRRVLRVATALQRSMPPRARALLLYPPGLDYVIAFFGALHAGLIAVPAYPPDPMRLGRTLPRLRALAADCDAQCVLTNSMILGLKGPFASEAPELAALSWVATDTLGDDEAGWSRPEVGADDVAFLQYTSGSTGMPRGVMVTHGNLIHNSAAIYRMAHSHDGSVFVSWLPTYHDMGLIGGLIQPMYGGYLGILMSPMAFLQRPLRWLRAITHYRGTTSPFPNFALDLCVRKVSEAERDTLDLSTWKVACNGAEPIRAESLERFAICYRRCGFEARTHFPSYGLAEATLIVSGDHFEAQSLVDVDSVSLAIHRVEPAQSASRATTLVACGQSLPDQDVRVVDPERRVVCAPGFVGELWVRGPSVAKGYWQRPDETRETFGAFLADTGEGPFLRTGDLGFCQDGQIFISGRLKDLIILRGQNFYPQDIEGVAERCHPQVRQGCCAAFGVQLGDEEALGLVLEVDTRSGAVHLEDLASRLRESIASEFGLIVARLTLLPPGAIPKTSSGKIQRRAARSADFLKDTKPLYHWEAEPVPIAAAPALELHAELSSLDTSSRAASVESHLVERLADALCVDPARLDPETPLARLGLDSLTVVDLLADLEATFDLPLPVATVMSGNQSLRALASQIARHLDGGADAPSSAAAAALLSEAEASAQVDAMSDDQVAAMLSQLLESEP